MNTVEKIYFFDYDGVISDTVDFKSQLFVDIIKKYSKSADDRILPYCIKHGGVPRKQKFEYIYKNILNIKLTDTDLVELCKIYKDNVFGRVLKSKIFEGVEEFLSSVPNSIYKYIVSGTPHEEINKICKYKKIRQYFKTINGSPTKKSIWISEILKNMNVKKYNAFFIGDSITDLEAAYETGVNFIGMDINKINILPKEITTVYSYNELAGILSKK